MSHLDPSLIDAILDGSLPEDQRAGLIAHLSEGCATCEAACADGSDLDALARMIDLLDADPVAPTALEADAIWRGAAPKAAVAPRPANRVLWLALPLVLVAAAAVVVAFIVPHPADQTEKGVMAAPEVHLRVLAMRSVDGRYLPEGRVVDRTSVQSDRTLLFEIETTRAAARYLWLVDANHRITRLWPASGGTAAIEPAGKSRPTVGGEDVALALSDLNGPIRVIAAASTVPLDAAADIEPYVDGGGLSGVGYDAITLTVTP